ncbi:MAG: glycosyltransferase family 2 protein [Dehalococcoidia bacterium]|nr:glycosyltransferase family 2 protein [Dehalococcoidia bacterium]
MVDVTVVIPTFNRHARLARTLRSLAAQTVQGFAVIVVDDGSTPPVEGSIPAELRAALRITVLRMAGNGGPARARNAAVQAADTEFVAFIDDDVDASADWLAALLRAMGSEGRNVVFGPLLAPRDWRPTPWNLWEARTLAREYTNMRAGAYEPTWRQFFTGNALVRRADILAAGGFDERFTRAEDIELGHRLWRLGCRFVFEPKAVGWHYAHRSLESWLNIPRQYARFDVVLDRFYPELGWLAVIERESEYRGLPAKLARRVGGVPAARTAIRWSGVRAARLLQRAGFSGPAVKALSLVYDIEYHAALRAARERPPADIGHPVGPVGNPASTGTQPAAATVVPTPDT